MENVKPVKKTQQKTTKRVHQKNRLHETTSRPLRTFIVTAGTAASAAVVVVVKRANNNYNRNKKAKNCTLTSSFSSFIYNFSYLSFTTGVGFFLFLFSQFFPVLLRRENERDKAIENRGAKESDGFTS